METMEETTLPRDEAPEQLELPEESPAPAFEMNDTDLKAILEGVVYVADEPLSAQQIAAALELEAARVLVASAGK